MRAISIVLAGLLAGCSSAGKSTFTAVSMPPEEKGVLQLDVPLFPDRTDQCGPASLAGVLRFWGNDVPMETLKKEIYRAGLKGSLPIDLVLAAQDHGMSAQLLDGGLAQVKKELDAGHPLVALVNQGLSFIPIGHYLVVTGYDARRHGVYVNSDVRKNAFMSDESFERQWERTDRWALLILPSGS
jgi:ABC-type bacteriocin/lantibiotic exporter with double-glycine peptidase domain